MRHKIAEAVRIPEKYRVYKSGSGITYSQWHRERWAWARSQPRERVSGLDYWGNPWEGWQTPLGDATDEAKEARECRLLDFG